jgi:hypothetical protein
MTVPDDREALRKAIDAWRYSVGGATTTIGVILAAARRDLARMEAERPKVTLYEMISYVSDDFGAPKSGRWVHWRDIEAAIVNCLKVVRGEVKPLLDDVRIFDHFTNEQRAELSRRLGDA